jgi:hypothetical protein
VLSLFVLSCANGSGLDSASDKLGDGQGDGDGDGNGDGDGLGVGDGNGNGNGNGSGPTGSGGYPNTGNGAGPSYGGAPPSGGDCCTPMATPGCGADPSVEACVCAQDDYCCMTEWDVTCVCEVDEFGCDSCGGGLGGSGPGLGGSDPGLCGAPPSGSGACCTPEATPGCAADPAIEDCVCFLDPYCCDTEWDDYCVAEVDDFGCGTCF